MIREKTVEVNAQNLEGLTPPDMLSQAEDRDRVSQALAELLIEAGGKRRIEMLIGITSAPVAEFNENNIDEELVKPALTSSPIRTKFLTTASNDSLNHIGERNDRGVSKSKPFKPGKKLIHSLQEMRVEAREVHEEWRDRKCN